MTAVGHLLVGPDEHGVVRFGRDVVAGLRAVEGAGPVVEATAADLRHDLDAVLTPLYSSPLVHTQYTDRLFGARCEESAELVVAVAAALWRRGGVLSATLHDLPVVPTDPDDPSTGARLARRRVAAYGLVVAACAGLVVCSEHERALLDAISQTSGAAPPPNAVIPLPIDPPEGRCPDPQPVRDLAVLGFLYPGKGHDEVLRALDGLPAGIAMTALGRPSDGHDDLVAELDQLARSLGRSLRVTGFVPDRELPAALRAAGVPIAPHRTISASGSIATWLGAGRRPLVPDVAYTRELEGRCPGALWPYSIGAGSGLPGLVDTLRAAVAEPARTWLGDVAVGPSSTEVAAAYAGALSGWA